jgi:hypothetical protein
MDILPRCPGKGYKLCKKNLHWYLPGKGCVECQKKRWQEYYQKNKKRLAENAAKWNKENRSRCNKNLRAWYKNNKEAKLESNRKHYHKNIEQSREICRRKYRKNIERNRKLKRQWKIEHLDKINEYTAKRRASKKQAVALWANHGLIKQIYKECFELTKKTNTQYHVDHIYPLKSDWLCGLHVETNLQILTETENTSKGNRTWPGQLDCQKNSVYAIFPKELTDLLND